ncbi:LysR substrate-binding domain-containing protein [Dongia sp.]|uniref:LysR substrate-binding domain-containing protein n=1 Tax=Dongia sp. TaxID=1977262 RepID=UPI0035B07475
MTLRRSLPSANALFVFEAAARLMSFTRAALELNVTQSAVSRMIGRLEAHIESKLFIRTPTGIELSEDGRELYHAVTGSFQHIEMAIESIRARHGAGGTVTISLSAAFAMHWFMPRLERFQAEFPSIDLRFQLVRGEPTGPFEDVDFAVRYNLPEDANHHSWLLMEETVMAVCSAAYLASHGALGSDADLSRHTLVHLSGSTRIPWQRFLAEANYPAQFAGRNLTFSDYSLVVQAALGGRGIALGWGHVVAHELQQKELVQAAPFVLKTGNGYFLVATARRPLRDPAILVRDWLLSEMQELRHALMTSDHAVSDN